MKEFIRMIERDEFRRMVESLPELPTGCLATAPVCICPGGKNPHLVGDEGCDATGPNNIESEEDK